MADQISHGAILDIVEQSAEFTFQAVDYGSYEAGKPFKSGMLSLPETANNRAALGSLYDTDGANKTRIIENVLYENESIAIEGSLVITGQSYQNRINTLTAFFVSGNALMWLDFGDTKLKDLDWSFAEHTLNYDSVINSEFGAIGGLIVYDLCDRGKFIDQDTVDLIERYPAFNLTKMLQVIFTGYDLQSNFITDTWFQTAFLIFTQTNEIRNDDDWKESALITVSGLFDGYTDNVMNAWTNFNHVADALMFDNTGGNFDNGGNWDNGSHSYTAPELGTYRFKFIIDGSITIDDGSGDPPDLRFNSLGGNPKVMMRILKDSTLIAYYETQEFDFHLGTEQFEHTLDTDYIELNAGEEITCTWEIQGQYRVNDPPGTIFELIMDGTGTLVNQVSRYYGYGSTVDPSALMPDLKVNDFLKMLFFHFGITPQYSIATNIVRLDVFEKSQDGTDLTYSVDPTTGEIEYMEAFDFDFQFKPDTADRYSVDWYERNPNETGNYKANNGNKVKKTIQSDFSNTVMQPAYRLDADRVKIPTMWGKLPDAAEPFYYTHAVVPEWKTTFNYRILCRAGLETNTYKFGYHVANVGRTVTDKQFIVFTSMYDYQDIAAVQVNFEFADRDGFQGLFNALHKAYVNRINNGSTLIIQGKADVNFLTKIANCDPDFHIAKPVYIGCEPYVGTYTIQKIVTDGVMCQFTLILNDE